MDNGMDLNLLRFQFHTIDLSGLVVSLKSPDSPFLSSKLPPISSHLAFRLAFHTSQNRMLKLT